MTALVSGGSLDAAGVTVTASSPLPLCGFDGLLMASLKASMTEPFGGLEEGILALEELALLVTCLTPLGADFSLLFFVFTLTTGTWTSSIALSSCCTTEAEAVC